MTAAARSARRVGSLAPNGVEKALAVAAIVLLLVVAAAIARGEPHWRQATGLIWAHLGTVLLALALTPVMLLRRRGDRQHRALGLLWVASLTATAAISLGIRTTHGGGYSPIHLLSVYTLVQAPLIVWYAHTHRIAAHRRAVTMMTLGALLIAGFFTFPFHRMLGQWLFG